MACASHRPPLYATAVLMGLGRALNLSLVGLTKRDHPPLRLSIRTLLDHSPANSARDQTVLDWLDAFRLLFLSVVTIAEIESGIANAARKRLCAKPHR